jgi:RNA polymerase sigma-32 factor
MPSNKSVNSSRRAARAGSDAALTRYIRAANSIPELSREEECELARRWADAADAPALASLVRGNVRHVVAIAISYRHYGLPLGELIAEGNFGLMSAARKFDASRGTRFVTYAAYWVRASILNYVIRSWRMVGAGSGPLRSKLFFRLRRERARIASLLGERAEEEGELLSQRFHAPVEKVMAMARSLDVRDVSLDTRPLNDGGGALVDNLCSDALSQEERFVALEERSRAASLLRSAIDHLNSRERFILQARMLADDDDQLSLGQIGRELGVSPERARQLEARVKIKLRVHLADVQT